MEKDADEAPSASAPDYPSSNNFSKIQHRCREPEKCKQDDLVGWFWLANEQIFCTLWVRFAWPGWTWFLASCAFENRLPRQKNPNDGFA